MEEGCLTEDAAGEDGKTRRTITPKGIVFGIFSEKRFNQSGDEYEVIYYGEKAVYGPAGVSIPLTRKEFEILEFLSMNPGMLFDKERIYERLWGYDSEGESTVVSEHIRRIRAKLSAAGCKNHIETAWGMGYKWVR